MHGSGSGYYVLLLTALFHMAPIVHIPTIEQDPHISHSLNALLSVIQGVSVCKNVTYWNFSDVRFLHPYFLSVLALYKQQCEKRVICQDVPADLRHFLADIYFELPLDLNANNCKSLLSEYSTKPYIPFCSFNNDNETVSGVSEAVSDSVLAQCPAVMRSPFSYAIGELMDNILEHSKGTKGYVFWLKSQSDNSTVPC